MSDPSSYLAALKTLNDTSHFNRWCGFEVIAAVLGRVELGMPWRAEVAQYAGFLHAGIIGALIDTACGFAAFTMVGRVLASHYAVNCLRPAFGERFIARAHVIKPGKTQVFTYCQLYATSAGEEKLVATGETMLTVVRNDNGI